MKPALQFILDRLESLAALLRLHGLTFSILSLKRHLGLRYIK